MSNPDPLFDALRRANPVPEEPPGAHAVPPPRLFEEITMQAGTPPTVATWHMPLLVAAAVVLLVALAVGAAAIGGGGSGDEVAAPPTFPTTVPSSSDPGGPTLPIGPGGTGPVSPGMGQCVELYSIETLVDREVAFDGTVTALEAGKVSFDVHAWYRGGEGATVTLDDNGLAGGAISSLGGDLRLVVGDRFLVAGDGGFVWACGFTQPYAPSTAASWSEAFLPEHAA